MTESSTDSSTHNGLRQNLRHYAGTGVLLFLAFAAGCVVGVVGNDRAISKVSDERDALLTRIELLQDPVELELIRGIQVGDDLADLPQLSMLVDEVIGPRDKRFEELYDYLYTTKPLSFEPIPKLPQDPEGCEILYFDLRTIENEAESYFVVTHGTKVLAVLIGEYWTV